jgi:hypothetical protein
MSDSEPQDDGYQDDGYVDPDDVDPGALGTERRGQDPDEVWRK